MIIIGHDLVPFKAFYKVMSLSDIKNIPQNSNVIFKFDGKNYKKLVLFCAKSSISYAVNITAVQEAILANAAGASFLVVDNELMAKRVQNLAEHYLFDAKILFRISNEAKIEEVATLGIDGALLKEGEIDGSI